MFERRPGGCIASVHAAERLGRCSAWCCVATTVVASGSCGATAQIHETGSTSSGTSSHSSTDSHAAAGGSRAGSDGGGGGAGGCPAQGYSDASGSGVTVGGGASPEDGGTELGTVCVVGAFALPECQVVDLIGASIEPCFTLVSVVSQTTPMPEGAACWTVLVQPVPCP